MKGKQGPRDYAETAFHVFQQAVGEIPVEAPPVKSEAAVKRGKARSESMDAERRSEIAKNAAKARWGAQ